LKSETFCGASLIESERKKDKGKKLMKEGMRRMWSKNSLMKHKRRDIVESEKTYLKDT
jgi:hypothetical protein